MQAPASAAHSDPPLLRSAGKGITLLGTKTDKLFAWNITDVFSLGGVDIIRHVDGFPRIFQDDHRTRPSDADPRVLVCEYKRICVFCTIVDVAVVSSCFFQRAFKSNRDFPPVIFLLPQNSLAYLQTLWRMPDFPVRASLSLKTMERRFEVILSGFLCCLFYPLPPSWSIKQQRKYVAVCACCAAFFVLSAYFCFFELLPAATTGAGRHVVRQTRSPRQAPASGGILLTAAGRHCQPKAGRCKQPCRNKSGY